jgi:hypothetical protein
MSAGDSWPLADPRAVSDAVVHRFEQHEPIDADRPRWSSWIRRARRREREVDPRDRPVVHDPTQGTRA